MPLSRQRLVLEEGAGQTISEEKRPVPGTKAPLAGFLDLGTVGKLWAGERRQPEGRFRSKQGNDQSKLSASC